MEDARGDSMVARIARVLRRLRRGAGTRSTLTELAAGSGLAVPTAYRIARDLVAEGLLERRGTRYWIGTRLWERGELAPISLRFREVALPHLLRLYEVSGENVHLAILDGSTRCTSRG